MALVALGVGTVILACRAGGWGKLLPLTMLMLTTAVSVFCKESGVVVFGVILLYDFLYRLRRQQPNWLANLFSNFSEFALKRLRGVGRAILTMFYVRSQVFGQLRPAGAALGGHPLAMPSVSFLTARNHGYQGDWENISGCCLWPQQLSCDYSYNQIPIVNWHFNTWEDWEGHRRTGVHRDRAAGGDPQLSPQQAAVLLRILFLRHAAALLQPDPKSHVWASRCSTRLVVHRSIMAERSCYCHRSGSSAAWSSRSTRSVGA